MNNLFYTFAFLLFTLLKINAQNITINESLATLIQENQDTESIIAMDSLIAQIKADDIKEDLIHQTDLKLSKSIFESIHKHVFKDNDSQEKIEVALMNYYPVGVNQQMYQVAFSKKKENVESLEIIYNFLAHSESGTITFSTPLRYWTQSWKAEKISFITYHYRDKIQTERAENFAYKNMVIAKRFKTPPQSFHFYMVRNYQEILQLIGFGYHKNSIGKLRDGYGVVGDAFIFSVMNNEDFSHDIFHYYSKTKHQDKARNWVAEEGIAYSWGNAYYTNNDGEMSEQKELIDILKKHVSEHPEVDVLELFEEHFWKDTSGIYNHLAPDFKVGRLISSIICDEVKKVHGMDGINQLITSGTSPNHFEPFYRITNQLIGLNRKNFNKKVKKLMESY